MTRATQKRICAWTFNAGAVIFVLLLIAAFWMGVADVEPHGWAIYLAVFGTLELPLLITGLVTL